MKNDLSFIAFEPHDGQFKGAVPIDTVWANYPDLEYRLKKAEMLYKKYIYKLRSMINGFKAIKAKKGCIPAREVWKLGDAIFKLVLDLQYLSFQIDGLYDHLMRDLDAKRMWLEKVIIFRRYLPEFQCIPASLSWGRCRDNPRHSAQLLANEHMERTKGG